GIWQDGKLIKTVHRAQLSDPNPGHEIASAEIFAIVVGISNYPHLPALKYADDDAYKMYAHLRSPEGGAIPENNFELLIDDRATKANIEQALTKVAKRAGRADRIVLFFSGHGLQDAFLPYNSNGFEQILTHQWIQGVLSESDCAKKLIFADACLSRQGLQDAKRWEAPSSLLQAGGKGTVVLLSSRMSETSLESDGLRQGVFSYFLFRGLSGAADLDLDQKVTIGELYRFVSRHVVEYTSGLQHPMLGGDLKVPLVVAEK
ncbi:MAG TPA: caspase family protein, partial [Saprospiraceae bacterium]|nr:caspase family protein [Saprospiraceae bacterium]